MESRALVILVSGAARPRPEDAANAESVGRLLALAGATVLTGGRGGVMEAASRGAHEAGGETLAILPGSDAQDSPPNPYVMRAVFTGMEDARNAILVRSADAVIAVGGGWGTLERDRPRAQDRPAGCPSGIMGSHAAGPRGRIDAAPGGRSRRGGEDGDRRGPPSLIRRGGAL